MEILVISGWVQNRADRQDFTDCLRLIIGGYRTKWGIIDIIIDKSDYLHESA
jgi:hypothetical protein